MLANIFLRWNTKWKLTKAYLIKFGQNGLRLYHTAPLIYTSPAYLPTWSSFYMLVFGPHFGSLKNVIDCKLLIWREEAALLKTLFYRHPVIAASVVSQASTVIYYFCFMAFNLGDVVLANSLLAYFANTSCFGVLTEDLFISIEADRLHHFIKMTEVVNLPALQYDPSASRERFYVFVTNQVQLLEHAMRYLGIFELLYFSLKLSFLPFIAPTLSSIGLFDNSPKLEFGDLPYSMFIQKGLINLATFFYSDGTIELSTQDKHITFLLLDYLVKFCFPYAQ